jgi:hypothetical protein
MGEKPRRHVLIIGAGSMGIVYGHLFSRVGVQVTFLVRPHRASALSRPQILYSFNDHRLETFKDYTFIIDPARIADTEYDYVICTLDGNALSNDVGQSLVMTLGQAIRGTTARVLLVSVLYDSKKWFLELSGLKPEQVTPAMFVIHAYSPKAVTLPVYEPTNKVLLAQADQAYADKWPMSIIVEDEPADLASDFSELWHTTGASACAIWPAEQWKLAFMPFFAMFAACELLDWPPYHEIASKGEIFSLGVAAMKEIQQLGMCGPNGPQTAAETTEASAAASLTEMDEKIRPLDNLAFNKYHHGGKVGVQDRQLLHAFIAQGEKEGKSMAALKDLLGRLEQKLEST